VSEPQAFAYARFDSRQSGHDGDRQLGGDREPFAASSTRSPEAQASRTISDRQSTTAQFAVDGSSR